MRDKENSRLLCYGIGNNLASTCGITVHKQMRTQLALRKTNQFIIQKHSAVRRDCGPCNWQMEHHAGYPLAPPATYAVSPSKLSGPTNAHLTSDTYLLHGAESFLRS